MEEKQPNQDFFSDNKASQKKSKPRTKLLKPYNMSYNSETEDIFNIYFVFDGLVLLTKNLNPFSIERKVPDKRNQDMMYMLCDECVSIKFYRYIVVMKISLI